MTFSFNVVLALFLLAPGLVLVVGVYLGSQHARFNSPPPPPGSILTLTLVTVGALGAHLLGAAAYAANDAICEVWRGCKAAPFDPNPYSVLSLALKDHRFHAGSLAWSLFNLAAITGLVFWAAYSHVKADVAQADGRYRRLIYGWLAEQVDVTSASHDFVVAYVVTDIEHDGASVGYEGVVGNLTISAEREITSLLLQDCETFVLRVSETGIERQPVARATPLGSVYLERTNIRNIAFQAYVFDPPLSAPANTD